VRSYEIKAKGGVDAISIKIREKRMRLYYNRERKPSGCMYSSIERPTEGRLNNWKTKEKMERYENTKHKRKPRTGIIAVIVRE
jgi:hypothetical protein